VDISEDHIRPFQLDELGLRGRVVRLGTTVDEIVGRHGYPPLVCDLLAETLALTCALAGALKFDGIFTLQTKSDGPISLLMADFSSPGSLRGYAQFDAEALAQLEQQSGSRSIRSLLGGGYIAFTIDQGTDMDRYQGIVELQGDSLAECALGYFRESEQLDTAIRVASGRHEVEGKSHWRAAALMLQRLPEGDPSLMARGAEFERSESDEDAWRRVEVMLASSSDEELLSTVISADDLLFRLYHQDQVRVFDHKPIAFGCRCSHDRAEQALAAMGPEDLRDMADAGALNVVCEFCNSVYDFTLADFHA
jgi:molecular chaperone Hsp33